MCRNSTSTSYVPLPAASVRQNTRKCNRAGREARVCRQCRTSGAKREVCRCRAELAAGENADAARDCARLDLRRCVAAGTSRVGDEPSRTEAEKFFGRSATQLFRLVDFADVMYEQAFTAVGAEHDAAQM